MADLMGMPTMGSESGNFDNDFEKVERDEPGADDVTSSTGSDYLSTPAPGGAASGQGASASAPLLDFDPLAASPAPVKNPEPVAKPDSSSAAMETKPSSPPMKPEHVSKPAAASTVPCYEQLFNRWQAGCAWLKSIDPRESVSAMPTFVMDLIYWRDVKKTGVVFGSMLVLLLSLALFSVLSVIAYLSLAGLTVTISFCVYKKVLGAVQKTGDGHPFKAYLDVDVAVPEEKVNQLADHVVKHLSTNLRELRRLFLVEDLVDSLKFGLLLWGLTYIGAWFNGMTLIILAVISIFTIPKFYETYKTQIDQYIDLMRTQVKTVLKQIQEKIPLPGKKKVQ